MSIEPLVLVHPFHTMDVREIERYYPKFPHLINLQRVVPTYPGKIFVLENENTRLAKRVLKEWGRRKNYYVKLTMPSDPDPIIGWDRFFEEIAQETPQRLVIMGGGFYEEAGEERGCVNRMKAIFEEKGYIAEVIPELTFSRASLIRSFCMSIEDSITAEQ